MSRLRPRASDDVVERPTFRPSVLPSDPRLLWPSVEFGSSPTGCDLSHFPDMERVRYRHQLSTNGMDLALSAFDAAVSQSQHSVLVLDPHFDKAGVNALAPALASSHASDIRLLTGRGDVSEDERELLKETLMQYLNMDRPPHRSAEVRWSTELDRRRFPFLHDRFAIVDAALWHFGSTVGGGHSGLTAASGPWAAVSARAIEFFDECWTTCNA